ncbi:MAG: acyltransferase family protein [Thainema sp.]
MKYRAEIDGLRALAVISVILFHAGFRYFSGGFVGVDVFFVISGYLITTIVVSEIEQDTFSLINFYERRARRILPALFLVVFVSLIFSWFWLRPPDMKDFSQSLIAIPYFLSNILFWLESGYWGTANELKPLLHTWTLAIEAQYYFIFPLYLMLIWRFHKRQLFNSLLFITAISFLLSQWGAYNLPSANFFLLPTRWWELALGASLALFVLQKQAVYSHLCKKNIVNEALGWIGLTAIIYSVIVFDETVPFPSFFALIPTVGTGLIILFTTSQTRVGQLLSTKYLVRIGLISYSAYLWHQPLFVFARHRSLTEPSQFLIIMLIILVFPLAYLSWKYIEKPFRSTSRISKKAIFLFWLVGSVIFIEVGIAGYITDGFVSRVPEEAQPIERLIGQINLNPTQQLNSLAQLVALDAIEQTKLAYLGQTADRPNPNHYSQLNTVPEPNQDPSDSYNYDFSMKCDGPLTWSADCRTSDEPEILIWGDSFAMHLVPGIMASNPNAQIIQMTMSVCGPFFDIAPVSEPDYPPRWSKECLVFTEEVRQWLKNNQTVKYAVLSSPFFQYLKEDKILVLRNGVHVTVNSDFVLEEFEKTLTELKSMGIIPVIFSPPPANGIDLGRCLASADWQGIELAKCDFKQDEMSQIRSMVYQFLDNISHKNYRVVRLDQLMCDGATCKTHIGSIGLYRDDGHLSSEGSAVLGKKYNFYEIITNHSAELAANSSN